MEEVVWRSVAGEVVLLDASENILMGLNETGGFMWALFDGKRPIEEIASVVAAEYDRDTAETLGDVTTFAAMLVERGLLRPS